MVTDDMPSRSKDEASSDDSLPARQLARTLTHARDQAARALLESIRDFSKFADEIARAGDDLDAFLRREVYAFVDYLTYLFRTGDVSYRHLYVGEKLKQLYLANSTPEEQHVMQRRIADSDRARLVELFRTKVTAEALALLESELSAIANAVTSRGSKTVDLLLVGDCIYLDILAFAMAPCLADDVTVRPTFVTSKDPIAAREAIAALRDRHFDAVFYSPFSYEFSHEMTRLMDWRHLVANRRDLPHLVKAALKEATRTADLLTDLFECNVFVHNTSAVRRHDGSLRERGKNVMTRRLRRDAADQLNAGLNEYVEKRNAATFPHLFVFDEAAFVRDVPDDALGLMYYDADLQHPAALGKHLAGPFADVIFVQAHLLKRKLVASDLDNTLWEGVIGEGAGVRHHEDRQRALQRLKVRGVVLAINSKNDPVNVRWEGGVLRDEDFVCQQVNWEPKVLNLGCIAQTLNLKTNDFVFIDDRPDEREMVRVAMPEVLSLDATNERAWRLLNLWAALLEGQGEAADRTQFYKQREAREQFIDQRTSNAADRGRLFAELGLQVHIRDARPTDLKRAAELINRTNQFNTAGSRTTLREVTDRHDHPDWQVLVIDAADKFGAMGTISVVVLHRREGILEINTFVLSCRVFGYGIETAILNHVKRLARKHACILHAPLTRTLHNGPCLNLYSSNGFKKKDQMWTHDDSDEPADPAWLLVRCDDAYQRVA